MKVITISASVKGDEVRRESEGVVVPEDKDTKTLSSPQGKGRASDWIDACVKRVSVGACLKRPTTLK